MNTHTTNSFDNGLVSSLLIDSSLALGVCTVIAGSFYLYGAYKKYQASKADNKEALLEKYNEDLEANRMSQILTKFSIDAICPDMSTMYSRYMYFYNMTNPRYYLMSNAEIESAVATVRKYKGMAKDSADGILYITQYERDTIVQSAEIMSSSTNDVGSLVQYPFRMCGFIFTNLPVVIGILVAPPTMFYTVLFQWLNQSYNAGLNFGNKNSTCKYTNKDIMGGYLTAVTSAILVAMGMRALTAPAAKSATGTELMLLNTIVACVSGAAASYCNTTFMRKAEVDRGIQVCSDKELTNVVGTSKIAAQSAVRETAISRSICSVVGFLLPIIFVMLVGLLGVHPVSTRGKIAVECFCILMSLRVNLPFSMSIFPPLSVKKGIQLEPEFNQYENIYFNKGL